MKKSILLATTLLVLNTSTASMAVDAVITETNPVSTSGNSMADPKNAAENFVEYVNYARIAIAMKEYDTAKDTIVAAKDVFDKLKMNTVEQRKVTSIESNRVSYKYENAGNNHYFPINAGPVSIKQVKTGPFWANSKNKGMAVVDAEVVNVTLDLNDKRIPKYMDDALNAMDNKDYNAAQYNLAQINKKAVKESTAVKTPLVKARDNLSLAESFLESQNYDGARYALKHADTALNEAEKDKNYAARKPRIIEMRNEITELSSLIKAKDPSALDKAKAKIKSWWAELKD